MGLLPRGNTLYGSVAPSWPPCPPSSRCGSPSRSMTSLVLPLSIENVSKCIILVYFFSLVPAMLVCVAQKDILFIFLGAILGAFFLHRKCCYVEHSLVIFIL